MSPLPIDPRWPHQARLNPLERPRRRWRIQQVVADDHLPGSLGQGRRE